MRLQIFRGRATLPHMYAFGIAVFLFAALPVSAQTDLWKTEIDNTLVRVVWRSLAPQETVTVSDSSPGLFVLLTDYPVRITIPGRKDETRARRGDCFWYSGGTITLTNPGEQRVEVVRLTPHFRPDPSFQLSSANPWTVEYQNEFLRVRRMGPPGSNGGNAVGWLHHPASSVMIELTSTVHARFKHISGRIEEIQQKAGDIWYQPEDPFVPEIIESGPEHQVLRIELKSREERQ
jgi:hypothetical protein